MTEEDKNTLSEDLKCLDNIIRHIQNVQQNCIVLGRRLLESGEEFLGLQLIHNGFTHDASKFVGSEWDYMRSTNVKKMTKEQKLGLKISISDHNRSNAHHPEFWGHIKNMPKVYLAECVCDWKARSAEFGTSLIDWINEDATKRFDFSASDDVYEQIMFFVKMLCDSSFSEVR